jgi:hypothetical protein
MSLERPVFAKSCRAIRVNNQLGRERSSRTAIRRESNEFISKRAPVAASSAMKVSALLIVYPTRLKKRSKNDRAMRSDYRVINVLLESLCNPPIHRCTR